MSNSESPIDYARTTRPRAGLVMKDRRELPGAALVVWSVICIVGFMTALAMGSTGWMIGLGAVAVAAGAAGVLWILLGRRRAARLDNGGDGGRQTQRAGGETGG
ncbi:hypothetical protein BHQ15_03555 [Mycolicibacillus koreensis]|nr:hypothetical protein BHQ15_03555 [Mycolicibacillus koreensis]